MKPQNKGKKINLQNTPVILCPRSLYLRSFISFSFSPRMIIVNSQLFTSPWPYQHATDIDTKSIQGWLCPQVGIGETRSAMQEANRFSLEESGFWSGSSQEMIQFCRLRVLRPFEQSFKGRNVSSLMFWHAAVQMRSTTWNHIFSLDLVYSARSVPLIGWTFPST